MTRAQMWPKSWPKCPSSYSANGVGMSSQADLCFLPAAELVRRITRKEVSAAEVMAAHLERIERINPVLNAIVTLHAQEALASARRADEAQARGDELGPLHGLPVAHKDSFLTRGMRTTFGSPIFKDFVPDEDSIVVERQRRAGGDRRGKTKKPRVRAGRHEGHQG